MLRYADGSDMMIFRNPAAWNNIYGMRPTWGLVPSEPGNDVYLHKLSTSGPMAKNPRDLATLLKVMLEKTNANRMEFLSLKLIPL